MPAMCTACSRTGFDVKYAKPCPGCGEATMELMLDGEDQHERAIRNRLQAPRAVKGTVTMQTSDSKAKTVLTIEIRETPKQGVYSIHAYDEGGLQIGQIPCSARAGRVVSTVADLVINAGLTGSLPLVGIEEFQRLADQAESPVSKSSGTAGKDEGPNFTDMVEGLAGFLRKAGSGK